MYRPNIFKYATRELSQDAMIAWLLECLHSNDKVYREIGLSFVRFIFNDDTINDSDVSLESNGPHTQFYHMDVYSVLRVKEKLYPIIFENKTNTYLHGSQFSKYCETVARWMLTDVKYLNELKDNADNCVIGWGDLVYVYLKTGFVPGWQKEDFNGQKHQVEKIMSAKNISIIIREIYLEDILAFLSKHFSKDVLLDDYYSYLSVQYEKREKALKFGVKDTVSCYESLEEDNETEVSILFQYIFGDKTKYNYSHQHWASKDLFSVIDKDGNKTIYVCRFEWCSYKRKEYAPAFQIQQYRYEKETKGIKDVLLESKTLEADKVKTLCQYVLNSMDNPTEYRFEKLKNHPCKSYDGQMILKFFITKSNMPLVVCDCFKAFVSALCEQAKKEFGDSSEVYV